MHAPSKVQRDNMLKNLWLSNLSVYQHHPEGLLAPIPPHTISDSVGLGEILGICISNKFAQVMPLAPGGGAILVNHYPQERAITWKLDYPVPH